MADRGYEPFEILPFDPLYQSEVQRIATEVLCHEYRVLEDLSSEPDLADVGRSFAPPHSRFLVAKVLDNIVGTGGLARISDTDCELRHLYVLHTFRRQGIASALVANLVDFVREQAYNRVLLELRPEMEDTAKSYPRYGFTPETKNLPRPGTFLSIRMGTGY